MSDEFTDDLPTITGFYLVDGGHFRLAAELLKKGNQLYWATTEDGYAGLIKHDDFSGRPKFKRIRFD